MTTPRLASPFFVMGVSIEARYHQYLANPGTDLGHNPMVGT